MLLSAFIAFHIQVVNKTTKGALYYYAISRFCYPVTLGTGQIQIKDIHYVELQYSTTWQFCQLLDKKYLNSSRRNIEDFYREATKHKWIKE